MMKHFRILHFFLQDKKNYHKDEELSVQWEVYLFYLNHIRQLSGILLKNKFLYFLKYKKIYILKVSILISILLGGIIYGGKYVLDNNSFFEVKRIVVNKSLDTIYVPDTIPLNIYINRMCKNLDISEKEISTKLAFVTFYSQDTSKNADKFLEMLSELESRKNFKAENGQYWGGWQMGQSARSSAGFGGVSKKEFLGSYEVQRAAVIIYLKRNYTVLKPYLIKYNNKIIRGYHLTLSGMLAMSHNCGAGGLISFLNSGCTFVPHDGNIPSTNYLTLGNYNIKEFLVDL